MLTDRQRVGLELFKFVVESPLGISYMARNIEGTKKVINDALTIADLFLESSGVNYCEEPLMYTSNLRELIKHGVSEEHIHLLNEFILHQLAVYHSNLDPRLTPKDFMNLWIGKTLTYLANNPNSVPEPGEYKQLIELFPPKKD